MNNKINNNVKSENKKTMTEHILDCLQNSVETGADLFRLCCTPYPETYAVAKQIRLGKSRKRFNNKWSEIYRNKKKFQCLLSKLKKEGLVEKIKSDNQTVWRVTKKGLLKNKRQKWKISSLRDSLKSNQNKSLKKVIIMSYDIPETLKQERAWIREVLKILDFAMIHKSVWLGNTLLPDDLLKEFSRRKILDYIEIFEVTKKGTLEKIK